MKKIALLFSLFLYALISYSQNENKYAGLYKPTKGTGDPQGAVNLYIMPDYTYTVAFFGGIEAGTWKEIDNYVVFQPDTTNTEHFYMFARQNDKLSQASIQFDDFTDVPALYSFDNDNYSETMHPVFNSDPNCASYPVKINFTRGDHNSIQLVSFIDFDWGQYPKDNVTHVAYTFNLEDRFNDFKIVMSRKSDDDLFPRLGIIKDDILNLGGKESFRKVALWNEIKGEDLEALELLSGSINKPMTSKIFGEIESEDGYEAWVESEYPAIQYSLKEAKTINFDTENLFTAKCEDSDDIEAVDAVGGN